MNKTIIIAEAGVNHNGNVESALKLVDAAADAGVDFVKFQTFDASKLVSKTAKKADYQNAFGNDVGESQFQMLKKLELDPYQHRMIIERCKVRNIRFFSTAFDIDSLQFLRDIGLEVVKIPSGEINNLPYLRKAAVLFDRIIISTGMANLQEIGEAVDVFLKAGVSREHITILHCNTAYPTPMWDVNLMAMLEIKDEFNTSVGYSDHTLGIEVPIAAVALGALVIEKHFTLDRNMEGPDHSSSLEPDELKEMVIKIRNVEQAISGSGHKEPSLSETKNISSVRKSIVAKKDINKGDILSEENLTTKRPGGGISPMKWDDIIGTEAQFEFKTDDPIRLA